MRVEPLPERLTLIVVNRHALFSEFVAELPHRREDERQFVRVVGVPASEPVGLYQQDVVRIGHRAVLRMELVTEDENSH